MSEFSESYHLYGADQAEGIKLLNRASLRGFVFPTENHWVTVLPEGISFVPSQALIAANTGLLLHYIHAEDHGWSFSLYEGTVRVSHYECAWEEEIEIDQEELDVERLAALIRSHPSSSQPVSPQTIAELLDMDDIAEVLERQPADQVARWLGLTHYEWLSYDYVQHDLSNDPAGRFKDQGIEIVNVH